MTRIIALACAAALLTGPVYAQGAATAPAANPSLTPAPSNPNLSVASVRMDGGQRASKIIGAGVYGDANTQVGSIDDLILTADHRVAYAVIAVGGLMGVGAKLVAVPVGQLQAGTDGKMMLAGATKDSLNAMPSFVYNG